MPASSESPATGSGAGLPHLYLQPVEGEWQILGSGTDISCEDTEISPTLRPACEALGYASG